MGQRYYTAAGKCISLYVLCDSYFCKTTKKAVGETLEGTRIIQKSCNCRALIAAVSAIVAANQRYRSVLRNRTETLQQAACPEPRQAGYPHTYMSVHTLMFCAHEIRSWAS